MREGRSKLAKTLRHPIVSAIIGGVATFLVVGVLNAISLARVVDTRVDRVDARAVENIERAVLMLQALVGQTEARSLVNDAKIEMLEDIVLKSLGGGP